MRDRDYMKAQLTALEGRIRGDMEALKLRVFMLERDAERKESPQESIAAKERAAWEAWERLKEAAKRIGWEPHD